MEGRPLVAREHVACGEAAGTHKGCPYTMPPAGERLLTILA
jgi:hypothetical protein